MSYEATMPDQIQMRLGHVHDQIGDVRNLMQRNRWALARDPVMFREYLDRIQTVLTDMYAQIPQNAPQRSIIVSQYHPAAPRRHDPLMAERAAPRRHDHLAAERAAPQRHDHLAAERRLNTDDTDDTYGPEMHIDDERIRSSKRYREEFGRKSRLY